MGETLARQCRLETGIVVGALLLAACSAPEAKDSYRAHNIAAETDWSYMPGVTTTSDELQVHSADLAVLALQEPGRPDDNPDYIDTTPVNIWGTHLELQKKAVSFDAKLQDIHGAAAISFLDSPPTRYDERVSHPAGITVEVEDQKATVRFFDGKDNAPAVERTAHLSAEATAAQIKLIQSSGETEVQVNDQRINLPKAPLRNAVWFGLDASQDWKLTDLTAKGTFKPVKGMDEALTKGKNSTLRQAMVDRGKYLGTAVDPTVLAANKPYAALLNAHFNEVEPEMAGKMQVLQPKEGQFEFGELDGLVAWAQKTGKEVHGHTLAFTEAYPEWLHERLQDPTISQDAVTHLLRTHIKTVVGRYDGTHGHGSIDAWDVVNEPFDPENWGEINKQNIWYKHLGESYIAVALMAAREANPNAALFINEWGMETDDDRLEAMAALVQRLKKAGVPVDGVGFQAHLDDQVVDTDELVARFERFTGMGLQVRISEASVAENSNPERQAQAYQNLLAACLRVDACVGMNMWGATNSAYQDRYFYFTGSTARRDPGDDAPTTQKQDGTIVYRPAWYSIEKAAGAD